MLLVLALVWGAFLVWWLRSRAQGTFGDSVGTFRRHLRVLERTAPVTVRPANRLRGPQMVPAYRPPAGIQGPPRPPSSQARRSMAAAPGGADLRRRQTLKRRRDVLFLLAVAVVATLVMAAATRSGSLIMLQVVSDLAMASYVALLVRMRNLAAERDMKLTYMPRERAARATAYDNTGEIPAGYAAAGYGAAGGRRPAGRRSHTQAGSSSGQGYGGYGYGSYGELAMRRAAN
ncbi:hypothetical protein K6U06_13410 [Acidiferrimicrobium sp. IK]|uniref:hypothetical protein n=1 Tax=Acidiferrimicrobium sp. IK TaxID=2871700 RepID=UPI0021CAE5BA|nr:hypothetical protein [Acidiferrimicrobium sp. IK]MCU4185366.1 hypothetical protein [Acidiferrimicrobium sp. IK]